MLKQILYQKQSLNFMKSLTFHWKRPLFIKKIPLFIEKYHPFIKNFGPPPYRKLQPPISAFIENSISGNNRDPWGHCNSNNDDCQWTKVLMLAFELYLLQQAFDKNMLRRFDLLRPGVNVSNTMFEKSQNIELFTVLALQDGKSSVQNSIGRFILAHFTGYRVQQNKDCGYLLTSLIFRDLEILSCDDCCHQEDLQHPCFNSHPCPIDQCRCLLFTLQPGQSLLKEGHF